MNYLDIDYETRSEADIFTVGSAKYAQHSSTRILMVSFGVSYDGEPPSFEVTNWNPYTGKRRTRRHFERLLKKVKRDPSRWKIRAHHSEFEYWITNECGPRQFGWPKIPMTSFYCTMSVSGGNSYPASEEKAGTAMALTHQKDKEGKRLIQMFSTPSRKKGEHFKHPHDYPEDFAKFVDYCDQDVITQMSIVEHCEPLTPFQNKVFHLTEQMNARGLPIDQELCKGALQLVKKYKRRADKQIKKLTNRSVRSATQTVALTKWLNSVKKAKIPNLKAETLKKVLLRDDLDPVVRDVLIIRQNVSKSSTSKYVAALNMVTDAGTVHGFVKAYLTITGRWAGRGIQIQNFSKPDGKLFPGWDNYDIEYLRDLIAAADLDTIELLYGDVMDVLKGTTRTMIRAPEGYKFICADFSQVEARIVMWMADDETGLKDFAGDGKIYEGMAGSVFGIPANKIKKPSFERDIGKETVLGCGFGMGKDKFYVTCTEQRGLKITKKLAEDAVNGYRKRYHKVPKAWKECERMAIQAIQNKGQKFYACKRKLEYQYTGNGLRCKLPSGRFIYYPGAKVKIENGKWGEETNVYYLNWNEKRPAGKKWDYQSIWGGIFFQHAVQGTAGDLMAVGMLRGEEEGYTTLFTVHDEALAMVPIDFGTYQEYENLLCTLEPWARGIPLIAEGWEGPVYKK